MKGGGFSHLFPFMSRRGGVLVLFGHSHSNYYSLPPRTSWSPGGRGSGTVWASTVP